MLKIVLDENIAEFEAFFGPFGNILPIPASQISPQVLADADVLVVRSVTAVHERLLAETSVKFVGSATAGTDHVDLQYLDRAGITFASAPGSNAESVAEYVVASLLRLAAITGNSLAGMSFGVVGVGHTGRRVADRVSRLGMEVRPFDPPRQEAGETGFVDFDSILASDVISLHVPLLRDGRHPTWHLFDAATLSKLKPSVWLVNASRGAVVDGTALLAFLRQRAEAQVVLDVWENEPQPDPALVAAVDLASPHVAGYSYDGKIAGSAMIATQLQRWINHEQQNTPCVPDENPIAIESLTMIELAAVVRDRSVDTRERFLDALVRQMLDVTDDTRAMRALTTLATEAAGKRFRDMRKHYRKRRSFRAFGVRQSDLPEQRFPRISDQVAGALRCQILDL